MRLVIYTQNGKALVFDNVSNVNEKTGTLFFNIIGNSNDIGTSLFRNHCGYTIYKENKSV